MNRMHPPGSQRGADIKKVVWGLNLFYSKEGTKTQGDRDGMGGGWDWQLLVIPKILLLKFIWAFCGLGMFLYVS